MKRWFLLAAFVALALMPATSLAGGNAGLAGERMAFIGEAFNTGCGAGLDGVEAQVCATAVPTLNSCDAQQGLIVLAGDMAAQGVVNANGVGLIFLEYGVVDQTTGALGFSVLVDIGNGKALATSMLGQVRCDSDGHGTFAGHWSQLIEINDIMSMSPTSCLTRTGGGRVSMDLDFTGDGPSTANFMGSVQRQATGGCSDLMDMPLFFN